MKNLTTSFTLLLFAILIMSSCSEKSTPDICDVTPEEKHSTNPSIVQLHKSMMDFRNALSAELLDQGTACLNSTRFYLWHNTPANKRGKRDGITYGDLNADQLQKFKALMQLFLSTDGYQKVNEISVLSEGWLNEIKSDIWNPSFYSIDMFGDPASSGSWGFQLDGHHCVVNFLVHGDQVSIVPAFLGGEPAKENYKGQDFDIFKDERTLALALYNGMSPTEKEKAITKSSSRSLQVGAADRPGNPDPYINDYDYSPFKKGLQYKDMSDSTKNHLLPLMREYVYNLNHGFADVWWSDIMANIEETYFVWIDKVELASETSQFYYRVYNPYLWIEFNTEDVTGANANNMEPWNHVHTITRIPNNPATKNGGDYGNFAAIINQNGPKTLYDHYTMADHHKDSEKPFDYDHRHLHSHNNHHQHSH